MAFRHFPDYPQPWAKQWLRRMLGEYRLITILREPVSRTVSMYNHEVHYGTEPVSFDEYLELFHERNHQSRWLGYDGTDPGFLENHFSMIGTTDRFDESLLLFRQVLNLELKDILYVSQRNDIPKAMSVSKLSDEARLKVQSLDWIDAELYQQANQLLDKYLSKNEKVAEELDLYRAALKDNRHPLWKERGSFSIGYATFDVWAEFDAQNAVLTRTGEIGA